MGQRKEDIRGRRETGGNWKKTEPMWGKGPPGNSCLSFTQDWGLLCGVFMPLVEHKGSNAELVPGLWSPKLIQLRGGGEPIQNYDDKIRYQIFSFFFKLIFGKALKLNFQQQAPVNPAHIK